MTALSWLLHELANRVNTTGLAMQLLSESKDPPCPPEILQPLLELRTQLNEAIERLHAMQVLIRESDSIGPSREDSSSSGFSAA